MQKSARHFSQCFHFKSLRFGKKSRAPPRPPLKLAPALRTACANVTGKEKAAPRGAAFGDLDV
jgi:hypothetical protein